MNIRKAARVDIPTLTAADLGVAVPAPVLQLDQLPQAARQRRPSAVVFLARPPKPPARW